MSASPPRVPGPGVDVRLPLAAYSRMTLVLRVGLVASLSILAVILGVGLIVYGIVEIALAFQIRRLTNV